MRVLVVDDLRVVRVDDADEIVYARTSQDAMAQLRDGRWDQVWLDHDLGGDDTAYPVAVELEAAAVGAAAPVDVGTVVVITDNPVGRDRLLAACRAYQPVYVPSSAVTVGRLDDVRQPRP